MTKEYKRIIHAIFGLGTDIDNPYRKYEITNDAAIIKIIDDYVNAQANYKKDAFREIFFEGKNKTLTRKRRAGLILKKLRHPNITKPLREYIVFEKENI